jgi:hypothetical protein
VRARASAGLASSERLLGPERLAQQQVARCPAAAGEAREDQRAGRFGNQRQVDERHREARARIRDDQVAMEQHGGPDPDAIAVDRGDDRGLALGEGSEQAPHRDFAAIALRRLEEIGEVVARGEILALAADGDHPDRRIVRGALDRVGKRRIHGDGDRVAALRPGERDREHRAVPSDPDMLGHCCSLESDDAPGPTGYAARDTASSTIAGALANR